MITQSSAWIDHLLTLFATQQSTLMLASAEDIQRLERRIPDIDKNSALTLAEWKHFRSFKATRILDAIDRTVQHEKVVVLHLNFQSPGLIEHNLLTDNFFARLQHWAVRNQKLLVVLGLGEIDGRELTAFLETSARRFTSMHFVFQGQPDWRWSVQFWFNGYSLHRWNWDIREVLLDNGNYRFELATHKTERSPGELLGDKAPRFFCDNAIEDGEFLPSEWQRLSATSDFREATRDGADAVFVIGLSNRQELSDIARRTFELRQFAGPYLRILIRARDESLRLQDERFLISAGATLVLPSELSTRSVVSFAETTIGFEYTQSLPETFEDLKTSQLIDDARGYMPPLTFASKARNLQKKAERQALDTILITADVATGLTPLTLVRRFGSRRPGDIITVSHGKVFLFLYGCRETDVGNVLFMSFGIPAASLFKQEKRLARHGQILDACDALEADEKLHPSKDLSLLIQQQQTASKRTEDHEQTPSRVRKASYL
ncbi:BcsE family c-di-GMP-binding protein [Aliidiomarina indica]|uniref:BcsE family c-di-GMP-binding protein n=1 Tax=Aliidiomarina indica TaxID=2749147 RepID=UPI00188F85FF